MIKRFQVFTPDAQYDDGGIHEREAGGDALDFAIYRSGDSVPEQVMSEAEALLVWHEKVVDSAFISRLPECRIIVRSGVGFDNIDIAAARCAGIPVCNTPDYGTAEVADHAIAMMLALERNLAPLSRRMTADPIGGFSYKAVALPRRLAGRRFGVVGMGRIGTAAALRARAFGMDVGIYDPYLPDGQEIAIGVRRFGTLADLAAWCDVLSLHAPSTDETAGMVDAEILDALGPEGLVVNTARGGLVNLRALHAALYENRIRAAALDVFPKEPLAPEEPLMASAMAEEDWIRDRLILTPHSAWSSVESCLDARTKSVAIVRDFLVSGRLRNCVNALAFDHQSLGVPNK
jgi:D-3-phosphoglycerate dehydrogenase